MDGSLEGKTYRCVGEIKSEGTSKVRHYQRTCTEKEGDSGSNRLRKASLRISKEFPQKYFRASLKGLGEYLCLRIYYRADG